MVTTIYVLIQCMQACITSRDCFMHFTSTLLVEYQEMSLHWQRHQCCWQPFIRSAACKENIVEPITDTIGSQYFVPYSEVSLTHAGIYQFSINFII